MGVGIGFNSILIFFIGPQIGSKSDMAGRGPWGPDGAGLGVKKTRLLNGTGLGNGGGPAGWVWG